MSKKGELSPDVLETILVKVAEKITDVFKSFMEQLVSVVTLRVDHVQSQMDQLSAQLTVIGSRINDFESKLKGSQSSPTEQVTSVDQTLKTLMALEAEKMERAKRSCNVIITGLAPQAGVHDADVFAAFCEDHLTVKPCPARSSCHRLGKSSHGHPPRLRLSLDNSQAVDDLIEASFILRESSDSQARQVYINRDYTKMEAQLAYEQRQQRRTVTGTAPHP